jgi:hypothetical protein
VVIRGEGTINEGCGCYGFDPLRGEEGRSEGLGKGSDECEKGKAERMMRVSAQVPRKASSNMPATSDKAVRTSSISLELRIRESYREKEGY